MTNSEWIQFRSPSHSLNHTLKATTNIFWDITFVYSWSKTKEEAKIGFNLYPQFRTRLLFSVSIFFFFYDFADICKKGHVHIPKRNKIKSLKLVISDHMVGLYMCCIIQNYMSKSWYGQVLTMSSSSIKSFVSNTSLF